jgi:hypothetical protein
MLPFYATPYKDTKKFRNQMSHHLRYFRFSNRTKIGTNEDLKLEDYFSESSYNEVDEDAVLLEKPISQNRPVNGYHN